MQPENRLLKKLEEAVEPDEDMEKGGFRTVKVEVL